MRGIASRAGLCGGVSFLLLTATTSSWPASAECPSTDTVCGEHPIFDGEDCTWSYSIESPGAEEPGGVCQADGTLSTGAGTFNTYTQKCTSFVNSNPVTCIAGEEDVAEIVGVECSLDFEPDGSTVDEFEFCGTNGCGYKVLGDGQGCEEGSLYRQSDCGGGPTAEPSEICGDYYDNNCDGRAEEGCEPSAPDDLYPNDCNDDPTVTTENPCPECPVDDPFCETCSSLPEGCPNPGGGPDGPHSPGGREEGSAAGDEESCNVAGQPVYLRHREMFTRPVTDYEVTGPASLLSFQRAYDSLANRQDRLLYSKLAPTRALHTTVLSPGWRHNHQARLRGTCPKEWFAPSGDRPPCIPTVVRYEGLTEVVTFIQTSLDPLDRPRSATYRSENGKDYTLSIDLDREERSRAVMATPTGLELEFELRDGANGTELHPHGAFGSDFVSTYPLDAYETNDEFTEVNLRVRRLRDKRTGVELNYVYESVIADCSSLFVNEPGALCDQGRGLLMSVSSSLPSDPAPRPGPSLTFQYARLLPVVEDGQVVSVVRARQYLLTGLFDREGEPLVTYRYPAQPNRPFQDPRNLAEVVDGRALSSPLGTGNANARGVVERFAYGAFDTNKVRLTSVRRSTLAFPGNADVPGAPRTFAVVPFEEFDYDDDADARVLVHKSPGIELLYDQAGSSTNSTLDQSWVKNGTPAVTSFNARGQIQTCGHQTCGDPTAARRYQYSADGRSLLGAEWVRDTDGRWTWTRRDNEGNVVTEVTFGPDIAGRPINALEEPADLIVPWIRVRFSYEGTPPPIERATKHYYRDGRLQVSASIASEELDGHDGGILFFRGQGVATCRGFPQVDDTLNWFFCGTRADRRDRPPATEISAGGETHIFDVTVFDRDSGGAFLNRSDAFREAFVSRASYDVFMPTATSTETQYDASGRVGSSTVRSYLLEEPIEAIVESETLYAYLGGPGTHAYDEGQLAEVSTQVFNPDGFVTLTTFAVCQNRSPVYDRHGRATCTVDANGVTTEFAEAFSTADSIVTTTVTRAPDGTFLAGRREARTPSGFGFETATIDAAGTVAANFQRRMTTPGTDATSATLVSHDEERLSDGSLFSTRRTVYDQYGRVEQQSTMTPAPRFTSRSDFTYFNPGEVLDATWVKERTDHVDADRTVTTSYTYYPDGQLETITQPDGAVETFLREGGDVGLVDEVLLDGIVQRRHSYDAEGRLVEVSAPDLPMPMARYSYGRFGVEVEDKASTGELVTYFHDAQGRLEERAVASAVDGTPVARLRYCYDELGRRIATYNTQKRTDLTCAVPRSEISLGSGEAIWRFDTKGPYLGTHGDITLTDDFQLGRLAFVEDEMGATFFEYDGLGRTTQVVRHEGPLNGAIDPAKLYSVGYTYGVAGELLSLSYPSGMVATYTFGADRSRPSALTTTRNGQTQTLVANAEWDPRGLVSFEWSNGQQRAVSRDLLARVTSISDFYGTDPFTVAYTYDEDGDVLSEEADAAVFNWLAEEGSSGLHTSTAEARDFIETYTDAEGLSHALQYEPGAGRRLNELTAVDELTYTYDPARGERLLQRSALGGPSVEDIEVSWGLAADGAGRIESLAFGNGTQVGLTYGPNGNVTSASTPMGAFAYGYDYAMRRVLKDGPKGDVRFRYGTAAEPLEETQCADSAQTCTDPRTQEWLRFGGSVVGVAFTAVKDEAVASDYLLRAHTDRMRVVRMVDTSDVAPELVARVIIGAFGQAYSTPSYVQAPPGLAQAIGRGVVTVGAEAAKGRAKGIVPAGVGFPVRDTTDPYLKRVSLQMRRVGQYEDVETGLLENRFRSMVPQLGIYTSPDLDHSKSLAPGAGVQAHTYAAHRPLVHTDGTGRLIDADAKSQLILNSIQNQSGYLWAVYVAIDVDQHFEVSIKNSAAVTPKIKANGGAYTVGVDHRNRELTAPSFCQARGRFHGKHTTCQYRDYVTVLWNAAEATQSFNNRNLGGGAEESLAHELGHVFFLWSCRVTGTRFLPPPHPGKTYAATTFDASLFLENELRLSKDPAARIRTVH